MAFSIVHSLRMQAVSATFAALPAARGTHGGGNMRLEAIRLSQGPCGVGTVACVARLAHHDRQTHRRQRGPTGPLGAPGGCEHTELRGDLLESRDEGGTPLRRIGDRPAIFCGA